MNKSQKLRHTLYEIEMKLIQLEFREKTKGLKKNEEIERGLLLRKKLELEEKVRKNA